MSWSNIDEARESIERLCKVVALQQKVIERRGVVPLDEPSDDDLLEEARSLTQQAMKIAARIEPGGKKKA